jgi:hypothetical protein
MQGDGIHQEHRPCRPRQADRGISGTPIIIGGKRFARGVGTHAESKLRVDLGGKATRFFAQVGVDDSAGGRGSVEFIVSGDGKVFLNQKEVDFPALRHELDRMRQADKDVTVIVRGHRDVEYQVMIKIFDTLQQADVIKVGIATELATATPTSRPQ